MKGNTQLNVIKTICWVGALADALWAVALISPPIFGMLTGRPNLDPDLTFRLTMGVGASLMAGWTALLFWCAKKPVERRAVMLLTIFPVLCGLAVVTLISIQDGTTSNLWILGKLFILCAGMSAAYGMAKRMYRDNNRELDY